MESQPNWHPGAQADRDAREEVGDAVENLAPTRRHAPQKEEPAKVPERLQSRHRERREELRNLAAENYLKVVEMQARFFGRVEDPQAMSLGELDDLARELEGELPEDRRDTVRYLASFFRKRLEALAPLQRMGEAELLELCAGKPEDVGKIAGYRAYVTNLSVDFLFDRHEDFLTFVREPGDEAGAFRSAIGLKFTRRGVPLTAQLAHSKETLEHERQHHRLGAVTIDRILEDNGCERSTRDELLAFFSQSGETYFLPSYLMGYNFWEKHGVDKAAYETEVRLAVGVLAELKKMKLTTREIIALLTREPIGRWPKVFARLRGTPKMDEIYQSRKKKRDLAAHRARGSGK